MGAQLTDELYAERIGIGGRITVADIVNLVGGFNEIEIDFGNERVYNKTFFISDTNVLANSKPFANVSLNPTSDHTSDEVMILGLNVYCTNVVAGVGFDLVVISENKLKGKFKINYKL